MGQESTTTISYVVLYILYFTVKEQAIFLLGEAHFPWNLFPIVKLQKGEEILYVILLGFLDSALLAISKTVSVQEGKLGIQPSNILVLGLVEA